MRILLLGAATLAKPFRRLGRHVLTVGVKPHHDVRIDHMLSPKGLVDILKARDFTPDCTLWLDDCLPPAVSGFEALPGAVIGWSIDQYVNPWHVPYSGLFDVFNHAQKDVAPFYDSPEFDRPAHWTPLFCNPERDRDFGAPRDLPTVFVGSVGAPFNPERGPFLKAFKRNAPLVVLAGDYVEPFNRAKIVLNQSAAAELNFRLFEAAACGAAVLTEDVQNGLRDLFTPGEDLLLYPRGNAEAAARIARNALDDPSLPEIAASGRRKVLANHSLRTRAELLLDQAETILREKRFLKRFERRALIAEQARKAYAVLAVDEKLPLPPEQRAFYAGLAAS